MKRIVYSFLLIALMSCGAARQEHDDIITLQFRDLSTRRYYLLSMRDSSMLVSSIDSTLDFFTAEKISFSKIAYVRRVRSSASSGTFAGAGIGLAAGAVTAPFVIHSKGEAREGDFPAQITFALGTCIAGGLIGCVASGDQITYDLTVPTDRESLKQFPLFRDGEPPQLRNIK